jgi:hypothetical protein
MVPGVDTEEAVTAMPQQLTEAETLFNEIVTQFRAA